MNLRHHTDDEPSIRRTTAAFEIVTLDDTEEIDPSLFETKPLDTPVLDQQIDDLIKFGERLDAQDDANGDDDDK